MASVTPQDKVKPVGQDDLWLICPICKEPNQSGTLHCKFCWGASLYTVRPITSTELGEFIALRDRRQKRLRTLRTASIAIGGPFLLLAAVFSWVYAFTDLMFAPPAGVTSISAPGEWAMHRQGPARTGTAGVAGNPVGQLKWSFQTNGEIRSSPAVAGGVLYFGATDYKLYAVDAETGDKRWEFQSGSWINSSPAVVNGVVYFGSNDGKFYALDAATGRKLWDFQTVYAVQSSPAVADGVVYFGGDDYYVYALGAKDGSLKWKYATNSQVMSSPVIVDGVLLVGSNDGSLYGLNAANGRFRLNVKSTEVTSSPAVSNGQVYYTSRTLLIVVDPRARNWPGEHDLRPWWLQFYAFRLAPPPPPRSGVLWGIRIASFTSNTTPAVEGDRLYTTADKRIIAVDLVEKTTAWSYATLGNVESSPALANGVVYAGSNDGRLYAISAADGKWLWDFQTGGKITSSPAYANGIVYVTSWDGKLYAIK